jgi:hypothetical protein
MSVMCERQHIFNAIDIATIEIVYQIKATESGEYLVNLGCFFDLRKPSR